MARSFRYDRYDAWRYAPVYAGWYPGAFWAGGPLFGWGPEWGWPPHAFGPGPRPYDRDLPPRRPPRESPTYGRGGDRAVRRWAREHGYDAGYAIEPRRGYGYDRPEFGPAQRAYRRWW